MRKQTKWSGVIYGLKEPAAVYVICGAGNSTKIGFSRNVPARIRSLQSGNPSQLRVFWAAWGELADILSLK